MSRILIGGIAGAVVIAGGVYVYTTRTQAPTSQNTSSTEETTSASSAHDFAHIISDGRDVTCTISHDSNGTHVAGTIYVADHGQKVRGDMTMTGTTNTTMHILRLSNENYLWGDGFETGFKTTLTPEERTSLMGQNGQQDADIPPDVHFECSPWDVDASKFTLPADQSFTDTTALMQRQASTTEAAAALHIDPAQTKAMQCAMCGHTGGISESDCREMFGCDSE